MLTFLNPKVLTLVSEMIYMIGPGNSHYSRVMLPYCDEKCQEERLCDSPNLKCKEPEFEEWHYNKLIENYKLRFGEAFDEAMEKDAKKRSFSRVETTEEGLLRYLTIAQAAFEVSRELTMNSADRELYKECKLWIKRPDGTECTNLRKRKPWKWRGDELTFLLIALAKHEGSFRRDVHSGDDEFARGDCGYYKDGKRVSSKDPEAERICRSVCLMQIKLDVLPNGTQKTIYGYSADDLVGTDLASTKRCFTVGARYLAKQRGWCGLKLSGKHDRSDWAANTFAAYGTGGICAPYKKSKSKKIDKNGLVLLNQKKPQKEVWPKNRSNTFWTAFNKRRPLKSADKEIIKNLLMEYQPKPLLPPPTWLTTRVNRFVNDKKETID